MHDWIEVFKAGTWTPSDGKTRTYTVEDLDRIVAATRANLGVSGKEAPAVIGHPTTEAPAWGWVQDIKREGTTLFVKFRDLVPQFVELVRKQMFPNRSISINPDSSLNHIGFLGAKAPAVSGLAPIALAQDDTLVITFETPKEGTAMTLLDKVKQLLGLADELGAEVTLPGVTKPAATVAAFSQADLDAAEARGRETAKKAGDDALAVERRTAALTLRKREIVAFCDGLKEKGHLIPAWEQAGIVRFMEELAAREDVVTFAEGEAGKKTQLQWFMTHLEGLPKLVTFSEVATAEQKKPTTLSERQREINRQLAIADEDVVKFSKAS